MKQNGMKKRGYRPSAIRKAGTVFALSSLVVSGVQAANIDLTGLGYIQHGDALVYSMPVANYQFGFNTNTGPYAISSTPGAIKDLTVIATGATGKPVTENVPGVDNAYETPNAGLPYFYPNAGNLNTPNANGASIANNGANTWDASLSALKGILGSDQMVFFFNNNQVNSGGAADQTLAIWARIWITDAGGNNVGVAYELTNDDSKYDLTTQGGGGTFLGDPTTYTAPGAGASNPSSVAPGTTDFLMAGGQYCVATGGILPLPVPVPCGSDPTAVGGTTISAPINHNLGADHVAYSVIVPELNAALAGLFSTVTDAALANYTLHLDVRMGCYDTTITSSPPGVSPWMSSAYANGNGTCLNNGYEQLFMGTAIVGSVIPEPQTLALLAAGFTLAGFMSRRRKSPLEREAL
ncbi:MAG: PEP-CTERM sorting domain-containing protein [Accumulibacter sp.]|uniref:PEP-CTERM sorting domain-containing protein n=1 Tax=Accumulibacter sp. TaxID=2053492 RepID=UPI002FC2AAD7